MVKKANELLWDLLLTSSARWVLSVTAMLEEFPAVYEVVAIPIDSSESHPIAGAVPVHSPSNKYSDGIRSSFSPASKYSELARFVWKSSNSDKHVQLIHVFWPERTKSSWSRISAYEPPNSHLSAAMRLPFPSFSHTERNTDTTEHHRAKQYNE